MAKDFLDEWRKRAAAVYLYATLTEDAPAHDEGARTENANRLRSLKTTFTKQWRDFEKRVDGATVCDASVDLAIVDTPFGAAIPRAMNKAIRLGYALARIGEGHAAEIPPGDAEALRDARLYFVEDGPREAVRVPEGGPAFRADVASCFAAVVPGGRTSTYQARFTFPVAVRRVDPSTAARVAELRFDDGRGGVDVLEFEGRTYRTVLAPGHSRAATEADFLLACEGGTPWKDDPFAAGSFGIVLAVDHHARAPARLSKADLEVRDKAALDALSRAGDLMSVDGVVYRPCPEPVLFPNVSKGIDTRVRLSWKIGRLTSTDVASNVTSHSLSYKRPFCGFDGQGRDGPPGFLAFPLDMAQAATDVARCIGTSTGFGFDERVPDVARVPRSCVPDKSHDLAERLRAFRDKLTFADHRDFGTAVDLALVALAEVGRHSASAIDDLATRTRVAKVVYPNPENLRRAVAQALITVAADGLRGTYDLITDDEEDDLALASMAP